MRKKQYEIIYEASISLNDNDKSGFWLEVGKELEKDAIKTLTVELPHDLEEIFGIKSKIYIKGIRPGSLSLFFGVVLTAYGLIASYKGFIESIELIENQAEKLLYNALRRYGDLRISVDPRLTGGLNLRRRFLRMFPPEFRYSEPWLNPDYPGQQYLPPSKKTPFFIFLIIVCIFETVAITALIYKAVLHTYF